MIRTFLPRGLMGRSLLILVVPVLLLQAITIFVFFDRHWNRMTSRLAYAVAGEITVAAQAIDQYSEQDVAAKRNLQNIIEWNAQHLDVLISFKPGAHIDPSLVDKPASFWEMLLYHNFATELEAALRRPYILNIDLPQKWISVQVQLTHGVMMVVLPQSRLYSSSGYIFLLWMIGVSLVLLVVSMMFMRNQIRPILRLAVAAERFGKGREVGNFQPKGAREVRQAAQAFIDMQRRIKRQVEQRTAMLAGVSHDLRTPLTRLKLRVDMMPKGSDQEDMRLDIDEMQLMVDGYLDFVRGDGDEVVQTVPLMSVLDPAIDAARQQGLHVIMKPPAYAGLITVRPLAMQRCLGNILGNAAKYAHHATITLRSDVRGLDIIIDDDGPGIAPESYEDVFKPFLRLESSRNPDTGGVGLGLSIAADIVHSHGGTITLDRSSMGGLRVLIHLVS